MMEKNPENDDKMKEKIGKIKDIKFLPLKDWSNYK